MRLTYPQKTPPRNSVLRSMSINTGTEKGKKINITKEDVVWTSGCPPVRPLQACLRSLRARKPIVDCSTISLNFLPIRERIHEYKYLACNFG